MDSESFYIQLISNSKAFDNNTVGHFKNRISLDQTLEGNWEMAVVEISYTYSWRNMPDAQWISLEKMIDKNEYFKSIRKVKYIKAGHYDSIEQLISALQDNLKNYPVKQIEIPNLIYDNVTKLLYIEPGIDEEARATLPDFSRKLSELLGFDNYSVVEPKLINYRLVSDRPPDLKAGLRSLCVYAENIVPQYMGDGRASILKTVEVPSDVKFGDQVVIKYHDPHYVPLLFNDLEIMEIDITDAVGDPVEFLFGITLIKLHLRKRNV